VAEYDQTETPETPEETPEQEMAETTLLALIEERESTALGQEQDTTSVQRAQAIGYYLGQPFGNEIEGRSQVVSRDVFDTVEWIKPSLLRIFAGGETVCQFAPVGPEDVESARASAYCPL
jgi:hypothetical protein